MCMAMKSVKRDDDARFHLDSSKLAGPSGPWGPGGHSPPLYWILISIDIWAILVEMKNLLKPGTKDFFDIKLDQRKSKKLHLYRN